ncbi:MAG: hypothetical protein GXP13_10050 [Gammaproteobacteria bacterium]|nr:hypothetical protein [Gammaproteobacteria bacterium]
MILKRCGCNKATTLVLLLLIPVSVFAESIKSFKFTGLEGEVFLRSFSDEQINTEAGVIKSLDSRSITELGVDLRTHSYVYHPKFLKIDAGGGPVLVSNQVEDLTGSGQVDEVLLNLNAHFNFLESKPYPFSFYFDRQNPLIAPSVNERILQENTKVGAKLSLRKPVSPVLITTEVFRLTSKGDGINLLIDDTIDEFSIRAYRNESRGGYNQLQLQSNRHLSKTGSKSLAIIPTEVTTGSLNFDSRLFFGEKDKFLIKNQVSYITQDSTPSLTQLKISPDLRWNHTESLYSFYKYDFLTSEQQGIETINHSVIVGFSNQKKQGISTYSDIHVRDHTTTGFNLFSSGISSSVDYSRKYSLGDLKLHARLAYDTFDRTTDAGQSTIQVFDESHILAGTVAVDLSRDFIVATNTSIALNPNILVRNKTRTQTYIENSDYRVIVIGSLTQIQRLLGGSIQDGEEVLVSYEYQTGGTFSHNTINQQYQANFLIANYVNVFTNISSKDISLGSGTPGIILNSVRNISYGVTADYPLFQYLTLGGEVRIEDQQEDIAPFVRQSNSAYLQFNLPRATSLRVTAQQETIDHDSSLEDVDLARISIRLRSRPFTKTVVTLSAVDEEDVGGTIPRQLQDIILKGEWNFRKLYFTLDIRSNKEIQGDFSRERNIFRAKLERRFR